MPATWALLSVNSVTLKPTRRCNLSVFIHSFSFNSDLPLFLPSAHPRYLLARPKALATLSELIDDLMLMNSRTRSGSCVSHNQLGNNINNNNFAFWVLVCSLPRILGTLIPFLFK